MIQLHKSSNYKIIGTKDSECVDTKTPKERVDLGYKNLLNMGVKTVVAIITH